MTFVFAARCKDGVVVAGDTRVTEGEDMITDDVQHKIMEVDKYTVIGFAGDRPYGQRFFRQMADEFSEKESQPLLTIVDKAEDILHRDWVRYAKARGERETDDKKDEEVELEILVVGLDKKNKHKATIYTMNTNSAAEESDTGIIGYGGETGQGALKVLWNKDLPVKQAWRLAVMVMKLVSLHHSAVGGTPDVYLVRDNEGQIKVDPSEVEQVYNSAEDVLKGIPEYVLKRLQEILPDRT